MHLLMTTYRQDIMTNFGCVCNRSTVTYLPMFQGSFPKHTSIQAVLVNQQIINCQIIKVIVYFH